MLYISLVVTRLYVIHSLQSKKQRQQREMFSCANIVQIYTAILNLHPFPHMLRINFFVTFCHSAQDDCIDSGSGNGGSILIERCWIESCWHEGIALSNAVSLSLESI